MGQAGLAPEAEQQESAAPAALLDQEEEEAGPVLSAPAAWAAGVEADAVGR